MGSQEFIKGLQNYLKKFQYKNASTDDLWSELSISSNKDIKNLMQNWTKSTGYPLIKASKILDAKNHTILKLEQKRFYKNSESKQIFNTLWKVPITIKTKSSSPNIHLKVLIEQQSFEIDLGILDKSDYILLNSDYEGFYRCHYSKEMFTDILNEIRESKTLLASSLDRIAILNDAFALVNFQL